MPVRKKNLWISIATLTTVFVAGLLMTTVVVEYGEREFRSDLLHHAEIASISFNPQDVTAFISSGTCRSACSSIWENLNKIKRAIPDLHHVYLMHLVDNQVCILTASAMTPCTDCSTANGNYAELSSELRGVFSCGQAIVDGPHIDESGEWVSGIAPVIDPHSGKVVAAVGLDIDSAIYDARIAIYRGFGLIVTFLIILLTQILLLFNCRSRSARSRLSDLNRSLTCEIAERQRAESSQREQLHFLQVLLDAIPCPVFYRDELGIYLGCNQAFELLLGKSKVEMVGKSVHDQFPKELADQYCQADDDLLAQGLNGIQTYESTIVNAAGKTHDVIFSKANFPAMDGNPGGVICTIIDISKRKDVERALMESELLFRSIFTNTAAGVVTVTPKGQILKANPAFCQFLGYSVTELEQMGHGDVTHPDDLEHSLRLYRDVVVYKPECFENEKRYVRKDGAIVWGQVTGSWVYDADNNPSHAVVLVLDITARKRSEQQLQERDQQYYNFFEKNHSVMLLIDPDSAAIVDANSAACSFYGYTKDELIHKTIDEINTLSPEEVSQEIAKAQEETRRCFYFKHRRACGEIREVEVFSGPVTVGGKEQLYSIVYDITEREKAEHALKKSEQDYKQLYQQFQGLLKAMPDTIMLISPEMKVVWSNRGGQSQFHSGEDMRGQHCFKAWQGLTQPCAGCPVQRCFVSGESEEQLIHDAAGHTWAVRAFPLKDDQGRVTNVIDVCCDITEKVRLRDEVDRNSRLASLGELSAGVAHEINNPNALILLNIPVIEDVFEDAAAVFDHYYQQHGTFELAGLEYQEIRDEIPLLLQRIKGGAIRIKRIVEDLKNFVRHGNDDFTEQVDLNEVVQAAIRLVSNTIKKSTDCFETQFGILPLWCGDFQRIEQVVVNLVQNACQALTDRQQRVYVATYFDIDKRCNVLEVKDEGGGIAPELLSRITDPFFTTRRQQGGTGLGLSISERIVREHGGQLEIKSSPGEGTTVKIVLPLPERWTE